MLLKMQQYVATPFSGTARQDGMKDATSSDVDLEGVFWRGLMIHS